MNFSLCRTLKESNKVGESDPLLLLLLLLLLLPLSLLLLLLLLLLLSWLLQMLERIRCSSRRG